MSQIVSTPREILWAWLNARIGTPWSSDFRALGLVKNDCLVAVIGYNGFMGRACFMHSAIDDPSAIDRTFTRAVFEYPFIQCGLNTVLAPVPADNAKALKLDYAVGFKPFTTLENADAEGKDLLLLRMRKEECRWIKELSDGQEGRTSRSRLHGCGDSTGRVEQGTRHTADVG
jgi:hypothetical protein